MNTLELAKVSHEAVQPTINHKNQESTNIQASNHNEEKIALIISMAAGFAIWNMFQQIKNVSWGRHVVFCNMEYVSVNKKCLLEKTF